MIFAVLEPPAKVSPRNLGDVYTHAPMLGLTFCESSL